MTFMNRSTYEIGTVFGAIGLFPIATLVGSVLDNALTEAQIDLLIAGVDELLSYFPAEYSEVNAQPNNAVGHNVTFINQGDGDDVGVGETQYVAPARHIDNGGASQWFIDMVKSSPQITEKFVAMLLAQRQRYEALTPV